MKNTTDSLERLSATDCSASERPHIGAIAEVWRKGDWEVVLHRIVDGIAYGHTQRLGMDWMAADRKGWMMPIEQLRNDCNRFSGAQRTWPIYADGDVVAGVGQIYGEAGVKDFERRYLLKQNAPALAQTGQQETLTKEESTK